MTLYIYWNPRPEIFNFDLPLLGRPLLWYGFLFALGFFLGYFVLLYLLKDLPPVARKKVAEKMTLAVILGTVIGARVGDLLFYQNWSKWSEHPFAIFKIWEGGLASHGAAIGILVALAFLRRHLEPKFKYLQLLDRVVVPTALAGCFIRLGNFINQEILGKATDVPWAVIFGRAADGSFPEPRHPVQLYESLFYLCVFFVLLGVWERFKNKPGKISGFFLLLVFTFRFFIEFYKVEQSSHSIDSPFTMGQLLSIPFIVLGIWLLRKRRKG